MTLGQRIKQWRGDRSFEEAAKILGCHRSMVFYLEAGERLPGVRIRRALKRHAGIDVTITRKTSVQVQ